MKVTDSQAKTIIQSAINNMNDAFIYTEDEHAECRIGEAIRDLEWLLKELNEGEIEK